jgi:alcohol dehydrogenase class IV
LGVVQGATSGILLPTVRKYNARHSADAKAHLWGVPEMRCRAESKDLVKALADLGDLLDVL